MDILLYHVIGVARWAPTAAKEAAITRVLDQKTNQPILLLTPRTPSYDLHDISDVVVYACSEKIPQLGRSSSFQLSAKDILPSGIITPTLWGKAIVYAYKAHRGERKRQMDFYNKLYAG